VSKLDHMLEPMTSVRRVEVITATGRRRQFSADDKARFVEETLAPGAVVSEVARRYGLSPQQLFTWRRQMRQPVAIPVSSEPQTFVPAVVTPSSTPPEPRQRGRLRKAPQSADNGGIVELEINGVAVRVGRGADTTTVAAVIHALKTCT
jgi:transposase